jgi:hypothetical protein
MPAARSAKRWLAPAAKTLASRLFRRWKYGILQRLDDFHPDDIGLVNIDVEGHELAVLRGAADTFARNRPTVLVEAEEHHHPKRRGRDH